MTNNEQATKTEFNTLSGRVTDLEKNQVFYGTCSTTYGQAAKVIACSNFKSTDLVSGTRIAISFDTGNTSNYMTLNVNGTGAVTAWFPVGSSRLYNDPLISKIIVTGCVYEFVYQTSTSTGNKWVYCGATNIPANGSVSADSLAADVSQLINAKAPLASPALTGTPTAPTASASVSNTQIATTAFVKNALANSCGDLTAHGLLDVISASGTAGFYHASTKAYKLLSSVKTTLGEARFGKSYGDYSVTAGSSISLSITLRYDDGIIYWDEYYNSSGGNVSIGTSSVVSSSGGDTSVTFSYNNAGGKTISIRNAVAELIENQYKIFDLMRDHVSSTIVIAASDSKWNSKKNANYICTGSND